MHNKKFSFIYFNTLFIKVMALKHTFVERPSIGALKSYSP